MKWRKAMKKLFDYYETHQDTTLWKRGVYPSRSWAETGVKNGWLYVMRDEEGNLAASCFWNQVQGKEYKDQPWRYPAKDSEVIVGHTLCVVRESNIMASDGPSWNSAWNCELNTIYKKYFENDLKRAVLLRAKGYDII